MIIKTKFNIGDKVSFIEVIDITPMFPQLGKEYPPEERKITGTITAVTATKRDNKVSGYYDETIGDYVDYPEIEEYYTIETEHTIYEDIFVNRITKEGEKI